MSRRRHPDKEKAHITREFENHSGSTTDFCRQRGISYQKLSNWRRQAHASPASTEEPPQFLELEIGTSLDRRPASGPLVELELGGGMVLRILPAHI